MPSYNFMAANLRIETERRAKYRGTASLLMTSLGYGISGPKKHVEAMMRMFHEESGCRKEDSRHHVKALISQDVLEAAVARASIPCGSLMTDTIPYAKLEFPSDIKLECLDGHDRLAAAEEMLQSSEKRWIVDLYLDDLSEDLRLLLADGYDYQKQPRDGDFYVTIRHFQGRNGEKNAFFENLWLGRLATNKNSMHLFEQLSKHRKYSAAFDALLDIPALFVGFRLSVIHQLLGMKCDEINPDTVIALEGRAPGASLADQAALQGKAFQNFPAPKREELWSKTLEASRSCLIPSLFTFFEDRKFLSDAAGAIRKILDVGRKDTIARCLGEMFYNENQTEGQCIIQLSETTFGSVTGDTGACFDYGTRQLWLASFRKCKDLPATVQKKRLLALSRTKADEVVLYELATLARRLGFESNTIKNILHRSVDREIAEHALLTARKPGQYEFHDQEGCIRRIMEVFAAATSSAKETADEVQDGIRGLNQPPKRYGRPNNRDHEYDKTRLFLPHMQEEVNVEEGTITSTFIRWSVYYAYFGRPRPLGDISKADIADPTRMSVEHQIDDSAMTTGQDDLDREFDRINQQIANQKLQLEEQEREKLMLRRQESFEKQGNHKRNEARDRDVENEQQMEKGVHRRRLEGQKRTGLGVEQDAHMVEPQSVTAMANTPTNRHTAFDFSEVAEKKLAAIAKEAGADRGEPSQTVRISFVDKDGNGLGVVEGSLSDTSHVQDMANHFVEQGYLLFDKDKRKLSPRDCFHKVVHNGNKIVLVKRADVQASSDEFEDDIE